MSELTVRRAGPAEAAALSAFMRRLFLAAYAHSADAANVARYVEATFVPRQQARELADPGLETLLAETADGWAGYAQLRPASRPQVALGAESPAELWRFYLDPRWHGSGAAARLMQSVTDRAAARS
ncbi:MAG TPA: GNAT family N-acetyltransferase, partial [Xanthomonadales bacterium]|nr:GNAT family N-acetyltransferase [Xanthomonadales bacterium]